MIKTLLLAAALGVWANNPGHITYEEFGAVGDGVHDDQAAIVAAHAAANEKGLPVKAKDGASYYIGKGAITAVIQTDVDFGTARFIINDVETEDYKKSIFIVTSKLQPVNVKGVGRLQKGQENLGVRLPSRCLVQVLNEDRRVYIRRGLNQNNGTSQKEMLVVEKDGSIYEGSPLVWDYDKAPTSVTAWPIDKKCLTIKGGVFITVANKAESQYNYRSRNIVISRSNVRVDGLCHYIVGEGGHGAPYSGFITVSRAAEVIVENCLLTPHKTYSTIGSAGQPVTMGSYDLQAGDCVNVSFKNIRQTINIDDREYWGLFASNFCKDLKMDNCVISRFDAHMGVCNVSLKDCTFGYMGVQMVGFGTARIENCEIHRNAIAWLRDDYGSSWDGDIILRNCVLKVPGGSSVCLFSGSNDGHHDFGYECRLPHLVDIDGLVIDDSFVAKDYAGPFVFGSFNRNVSEEGLFPFAADGRISLKNVIVKSGKALGVSANKELFTESHIETN